jgi:predicted nucleotide-binding protein
MPRKPVKRPKTEKRDSSRKRQVYSVFISHSSKDQFIAEAIAEKIEALGAKFWIDTKHLEGGDSTIQEIINAIDTCNEAIVIVSPDSITSQWVSFEIGVVRSKNKRITPLLHDTSPNDMAPMKDIAAIDLNNLNHFLAQLEKRIKQRH